MSTREQARWRLSFVTLVIASVIFLSGSGFAEAASASPGARELKESIHTHVCEGLRDMFTKLPRTVRMPSFCRILPPPPTVVVDLQASASTIEVGESFNLSWASSGAETCAASGGWTGNRGLNGNEQITPDEEQTYILTCTNAGGSVSDSVTVAVTQPDPEPTVSIDALPLSLMAGATSTLTWVSTNATECTASNAWSGIKAMSSSEVITPNATGTYTLTCVGAGGSAVDSVVVEVNHPEPTVDITASDTSITEGESSELSWGSTHTTSCEAENGWSGNKNVLGTEVVSPLVTTTYTLNCVGPGGVANDSVTVVVTPLPSEPIVSLVASLETITEGESVDLTWTSTNVDTCVAEDGWTGGKTATGTEVVSPTETTLYTLVCTGPGGQAEDSVSVEVTPVVPALDHLVISEVYYDVDSMHGVEGSHEWIELYNPTSSPVSLVGWSIIDTNGSVDTIPSGVQILPGGFVLLTASTTITNFWNVPANVPIVNFNSSLGNGLGNTGDSLLLRDASLAVVDGLSWGTNTQVFATPVPTVAEGHSLARSPVDEDGDDASDWIDREVPTFGI